MKILIGRKVRGFKFENGDVYYGSKMDKHIGEIGTIESVVDNYVWVQFKDDSWNYPLDQVEKHLVSKNPTAEAIELLEAQGYKVTKVIPICAMCLFADSEDRFKNNLGIVDIFKGMDGDKFRSTTSSWKYCKQITITDV